MMYWLNHQDGISSQGEEASPINASNSIALIVERVKENISKKRLMRNEMSI